MDFLHYENQKFYDEFFQGPNKPRDSARPLFERISNLSQQDILIKQRAAEAALFQMGITFAVYGDARGTEKIFPFDIIPRILSAAEWDKVERGLKQRITAINLFLQDIYGAQKILKDKIIPEDLILSGNSFRKECMGLRPPHDIWSHISGTDLVRDEAGRFFVLEDNLRCPSGVSYVLENREVLKRTWPFLFDALPIRPVDDYANRLLELLQYISPRQGESSQSAILTPGVYNSAYFEHSFLAREMGIPLVEGQDLVVQDEVVYMRTTKGFERIDVLYRRVDDDFLDPLAFRADSMLGVPGLMAAYRSGKVALANAPGTGIADDKAVYAYIPRMIRYYLDQDEILPNVPTHLCWEEKEKNYVLENLDKLVVKSVNESGGYGMLMGTQASRREREEFAEKIRKHPRNFIAQPTLKLSRTPVIFEQGIEGRHVDLRPYILYGEDIFVLPGGLTRVALKKNSLVVNSSQGGGSKDTWVLAC